MKTITIVCCFYAVFGIIYGLPYAYEQEHEDKNLLTELIGNLMDTTQQDNVNAETLALKLSAIQAVAEAAKADPHFIWYDHAGAGK